MAPEFDLTFWDILPFLLWLFVLPHVATFATTVVTVRSARPVTLYEGAVVAFLGGFVAIGAGMAGIWAYVEYIDRKSLIHIAISHLLGVGLTCVALAALLVVIGQLRAKS